MCNSGNVDLMVATNSTSCPTLVTEVTPGIGPGACPETTDGICSQLVTDLSGTAPYSHIVANLESGDAYYFQVSAHNKMGYGLPSITAPSSIVPTFNNPGKPPPVRLVESCVAPTCAFTSITVEWTYPGKTVVLPSKASSCGWTTGLEVIHALHLMELRNLKPKILP